LAGWIEQGQVVIRIIVGDEATADLAEVKMLGIDAEPLPISTKC
jgi:hypothetical protein